MPQIDGANRTWRAAAPNADAPFPLPPTPAVPEVQGPNHADRIARKIPDTDPLRAAASQLQSVADTEGRVFNTVKGVNRSDQTASGPAQAAAATTYTPSPGCEPIGRRDDPLAEGRGVARLAVARAMDFAHSDQGRQMMRANGDGFLNVVNEYMNSAFAQRCNPIHMQSQGDTLVGHDNRGHSIRVTGDEDAAAISLNLGHVADANMHVSYDRNGLVHESMRKADGAYTAPALLFGPGANYVMRYHGMLNNDQSIAP